jgi:hypothetical protein
VFLAAAALSRPLGPNQQHQDDLGGLPIGESQVVRGNDDLGLPPDTPGCRIISPRAPKGQKTIVDQLYPRRNRAPQVTQRMMSFADMVPAAAPIAAPTIPPAKKPAAVIVPVTPGAPNDVPWHLGHAPSTVASLNRGHDG